MMLAESYGYSQKGQPERIPFHSARRAYLWRQSSACYCTSDLQLGGNGNSAIISRLLRTGRPPSERRPSILFLSSDFRDLRSIKSKYLSWEKFTYVKVL